MTPKVYMNKKSGDLVILVPWYSPIDPVYTIDEGDSAVIYGLAMQVGWMLENGHNCFFGLGMKAIRHFELIGEL